MAKRVVKENSERHQANHTGIAPSKTPFISFCLRYSSTPRLYWKICNTRCDRNVDKLLIRNILGRTVVPR